MNLWMFLAFLFLSFFFTVVGRRKYDVVLFLLGSGLLFVTGLLLFTTGLSVPSGGTEIVYTNSDLSVWAFSMIIAVLGLLGIGETLAVFKR